MTEEAQTEEDPSIEEILDSIRQIISEDEDDETASDDVAEEPVAEEPLDQSAIDDMDFDAPAPEPVSEEPLDQSAIDDIDFDTPAVVPDPEPEPEPIPVEEEDILELTERVEEPKSAPIAPVVPAAVEEDALLTDVAEEAAFDAISELARKTAVEHSGITLEDIVRSELKPLLRGWLDKNLPVVIERLVREELERVSKRVLDE